MPKQKIEIEVDVPDGWEVTGEYRKPLDHEPYISKEGWLAERNIGVDGPRIILRKKYVPPAWLKPGTWLFFNGVDWFATNVKPESSGTLYQGVQGPCVCSRLAKELFPDFVPPPTNPYQIPEQK